MHAVTFRDVRPYLSLSEERRYRGFLAGGDETSLRRFRAAMTERYEDEVLAEREFAGSAA